MLTPEFLVFFEEYLELNGAQSKASPHPSRKVSERKHWFHLILFKMASESSLFGECLDCLDKQLKSLKKSLQSSQQSRFYFHADQFFRKLLNKIVCKSSPIYQLKKEVIDAYFFQYFTYLVLSGRCTDREF